MLLNLTYMFVDEVNPFIVFTVLYKILVERSTATGGRHRAEVLSHSESLVVLIQQVTDERNYKFHNMRLT